jgi:hypothetical protein
MPPKGEAYFWLVVCKSCYEHTVIEKINHNWIPGDLERGDIRTPKPISADPFEFICRYCQDKTCYSFNDVDVRIALFPEDEQVYPVHPCEYREVDE